ncbi:MAG: DUF4468 domain-containing protein [Flavobacteriaceae bacterium]
MRKIAFTLLFIATLTTSNAQDLPVDAKSGKITFMKTVDASGMTAQQLYDVAKEWGAEKNYSVDEDVPGKKITFKASTEIEYPVNKSSEKTKGTANFKFQLGAKEGKYRYIFTNFEHTGSPEDAGALEDAEPDCTFTKISIRGWTVLKKDTHKKMLILIDELTKKIKAVQNDPTKNDDW